MHRINLGLLTLLCLFFLTVFSFKNPSNVFAGHVTTPSGQECAHGNCWYYSGSLCCATGTLYCNSQDSEPTCGGPGGGGGGGTPAPTCGNPVTLTVQDGSGKVIQPYGILLNSDTIQISVSGCEYATGYVISVHKWDGSSAQWVGIYNPGFTVQASNTATVALPTGDTGLALYQVWARFNNETPYTSSVQRLYLSKANITLNAPAVTNNQATLSWSLKKSIMLDSPSLNYYSNPFKYKARVGTQEFDMGNFNVYISAQGATGELLVDDILVTRGSCSSPQTGNLTQNSNFETTKTTTDANWPSGIAASNWTCNKNSTANASCRIVSGYSSPNAVAIQNITQTGSNIHLNQSLNTSTAGVYCISAQIKKGEPNQTVDFGILQETNPTLDNAQKYYIANADWVNPIQITSNWQLIKGHVYTDATRVFGGCDIENGYCVRKTYSGSIKIDVPQGGTYPWGVVVQEANNPSSYYPAPATFTTIPGLFESGISRYYSIAGNLFVDNNDSKSKDIDEPNYTGGPASFLFTWLADGPLPTPTLIPTLTPTPTLSITPIPTSTPIPTPTVTPVVPPSPTPTPEPITNIVTNFSTTQGGNSFYYLTYNLNNSQYTQFPWNATQQWWGSSSNQNSYIKKFSTVLGMNAEPNIIPVVRWVAYKNGPLTISGSFQRTQNAGGVRYNPDYSIRKNGTQVLWNQTTTTQTKYSFSVTTSVSQNDTIEFWVNANSNVNVYAQVTGTLQYNAPPTPTPTITPTPMLPTPTSVPNNFVHNNSFESTETTTDPLWNGGQKATGWDCRKVSEASGNCSVDTSQKHSGNKSVKITNTTSGYINVIQLSRYAIFNSFDPSATCTYNVSTWIKQDTAQTNPPLQIGIKPNGAQIGSEEFGSFIQTINPTTNWQQIQGQVQFSGAVNLDVYIQSRHSPYILWIDDVVLTRIACTSPTPTPTSVLTPTVTPTPNPSVTIYPTPTLVIANTTNGTFNVGGLLQGLYRVSYTSALPDGYQMSVPLNGPPPSYIVSVGDVCTPASLCTNGSIQNLNFGLKNNVCPWFVCIGADCRNDNGIANACIPPVSTPTPTVGPGSPTPTPGGPTPTPGAINPTACGNPYVSIPGSSSDTPGVILSGDSLYDFGEGQASPNPYNWIVGGTVYPEVFTPSNPTTIRTSYDYLLGTAQRSGLPITDLATVCNLNDCNLTSVIADFPSGVYKANSDVHFKQYNVRGNRSYVFLINGTFYIEGNVTINSGSSLTVSASQDIRVISGVGETDTTSTTANVEGFYSADRNFIVEGLNSCPTIDKRLNIKGAVVVNAKLQGGSFTNNRTLCNNTAQCPTFTFTERPDLIINAPEVIKHPTYLWKEVAP